MTNEQILKKAIEKAIKNGWENKKFWFTVDDGELVTGIITKEDVCSAIFSHKFAKALWGEEEKVHTGWQVKGEREYFETIPIWQYHLQQMVLEKDPLKYIEKFL